MDACRLCGCTEETRCVDGRLPTGKCCWVNRGGVPVCSKHFPYIPEGVVPEDELGPEQDERPDAPLLQTFTEAEMKEVCRIYDQRVRMDRDARRRVF